MDGKVHLAELDSLLDALLAVDGQSLVAAAAMLLNEAGALHEHAARAARGIENLAVERFDRLDDQSHD